MSKDSFIPSSSGRRSTVPLGTTATRPLEKVTTTMGVLDDELRARARALVEGLGQRMEILLRACQAAKLPMPGIIDVPQRNDMPPNATRFLAYLVAKLPKDPAMARAVQVAIFRFQQIEQALAQADKPTDLEQLRRNIFLVTNLSAELKGDPILATLFPSTKERSGLVEKQILTPDELRRKAKAREEAIERADELGKALAPRMGVAQLAMVSLEKGLGHNVSMVLTPEGRLAKLIAISLTNDPPHHRKLTVAHGQFETLKQVVANVKAKRAEPDALRPLVVPLGQLGTTFAEHALLRELFTRRMAS